jgi:hypothetical protein
MAIPEIDAVCANTHPTGNPSGIAGNEGKIRHVFRYHRARADKGILPDRDAANDCTISTESRASANQGWTQFIHPLDLAARIQHIGKNHRRTAKYMVFESHSFVNTDIVLYFDAVADVYVGPNNDILPNPAIFTNL